jgi:hypothetical protein
LEPLETQFVGAIEGVSRADLEAARHPVSLPDGNWRYVIEAPGCVVTIDRTNPWLGRPAGDVHAREYSTGSACRLPDADDRA